MNMNNTTLNWQICRGNEWCRLYDVTLNPINLDNLPCVYIIWYWNNHSQRIYVKIGQTDDIKSRIIDHRTDYRQNYSGVTLNVTWAQVSQTDQDGVENYLGKLLKPKDHYPNAPPIPVNLPPWQ